MLSDRTFAGLALAAVTAVGLLATPAVSAIGDANGRAAALSALVGRFTPATGDPVLLERYARLSDEARANFRFTPALPRSENRAVTLVVRARPNRSAATSALVDGVRDGLRDGGPQPIAIAPVTYRLGSVDIAALPAARRPADTTRRPSRFGADMRLDSNALPATADQAVDPDRVYSVDMTGSYRLSRNLDLTAGVRIERENDRLQPLTDSQRDSQAVYVGTQFRF